MTRPIKQAQRDAILAYIKDYIGEHGYAPTLREIAGALHMATISTVKFYLDRLQGEGMLTRDFRRSRSIVLTQKGKRYHADW